MFIGLSVPRPNAKRRTAGVPLAHNFRLCGQYNGANPRFAIGAQLREGGAQTWVTEGLRSAMLA
jgi:hypothetical protein